MAGMRSIFDDDIIKWKHFPRYWPFVLGFHLSPVNSPHKGQWRGALMISLIWARTNDSANNRDTGDLRRHRGHYDVTVILKNTWHLSYLQTCCSPLWHFKYDRWPPNQITFWHRMANSLSRFVTNCHNLPLISSLYVFFCYSFVCFICFIALHCALLYNALSCVLFHYHVLSYIHNKGCWPSSITTYDVTKGQWVNTPMKGLMIHEQ